MLISCHKETVVRLLVRTTAALFLLAGPVLAATKTVDLGPLSLELSDSPTAQVFHIVDQLSLWDQYAHQQYSRWAKATSLLDDEDRELLKKHSELRNARGWNNGFEQAFLVDDSIEGAAHKAVDTQLLSASEAHAEAGILQHFAPKLAPLLEQQHSRILAFEEQVAAEQARLTPIISLLAAFAESKGKLSVPVFVVANPDEGSGGGEANGGRLVVELPGPDPVGALLHEAMHFLLKSQQPAIRAAAEGAGLDETTLAEGLAYAFSPGITDNPERADRLTDQLVRFELRGRPVTDAYVKSHMLAVEIRPLLRSALKEHQTITTFLPIVVRRWREIAPDVKSTSAQH